MDHPPWYRRARIAGVVAAVPGYVTMFAIFPTIAADPRPGEPRTEPDWFPTVYIGALFLITAGTILVLAPLAHRLPETLKRLCDGGLPSAAERARRR
jgi:hypothetical protein